MQELILKWALKNAVDHHGKALVNALIPKVIGENPKLRNDMKTLAKAIADVVSEVNRMKPEAQMEQLMKLAPELLEKREEKLPELPNVKGRVVMRMAPYPSGPLHIGNTRMVILNDEYVKRYGGELLLVIDDTIGSEEKIPIAGADKMIIESLDWLGVKYSKVIYKSDRMELFYKKAEDMISKGFAYVCECSSDELRSNRVKGIACKHRSQDKNVNLEKWQMMLGGKYKEGGAVVRLKTDMKHKNPAFRDRVLLRISYREHPRVGHKYHVWPLLEFSWAVDDHELGVTHVLRGKDLVMEDEMENYIWDLYKKRERPTFMHYGMLKIETGFKLSKTKAREMIERGEYTGWDDPRIWSLQSLKRRGIRPGAIRDFIVSLGMSLADVAVPVEILYSKNRSIIDKEADRYFFVEKPVKVEVTGAPKKIVAKVPVHPEKTGFRTFAFSDGLKLLVEKDDLAMLKKEKMVRLKDLANVGFSAGKVCYSKDQSTVYEIKKMHWLPEKGNVDVRILMPDGKWIEGIAEPDIKKVKRDDIIQFERFGFCRFDGKDFIFSHK